MEQFPDIKDYTGEKADAIDKATGADEEQRIVNEIKNFKQKHKSDYDMLQKIAKRNRDYWRAKQIDESDLYVGESPIIDNRIFMALETIVPIVTRKTPEPDVVVRPSGGRNLQLQEKIEVFLKELWEVDLNMQAKMEATVRNLFASRYGAVKYYYDEKRKGFGVKVMPMGKLLFNLKAECLDDTDVIEFVTTTLGDLKERFPEKAEEIAAAAGLEQKSDDSEVEYVEFWKADGSYYACEYRDILLYKGVNPNWNWQDPFAAEETNEDADEDELHMEKTQKSFNHLPMPVKPYVLLNQLTWGDSLVDDTSLIEQVISLQDSINKRKRNTEQNAGMANGKIVAAGKRISKEDFDEIDSSPEQKIYLENAETTQGALDLFYGRTMDNGLFQDMQHSIMEVDNVMGTHATTRGESNTQETATGRAILKEADAGRLEVLTRHIEKFAQELYNALIQMIYVHFDEQHPINYYSKPNNRQYLTAKEREVYIIRDEFKDVNVTVLVQAGSTVPRDKMTQKAEAVDLASQGLMSKKDMYKILEYPNPDDMARNAYLEQTAPQMLYDTTTGDLIDIEAIRHTSIIVNAEYPETIDVPIYESDDPDQYAKHLSTHQEYLKGTEIDPDLPSFDELDLDTKQKLIDHIQKEMVQAEALIEEMQAQQMAEDPMAMLGGEELPPEAMGVMPPEVAPGLEGPGQLAAQAAAGAGMQPPAQVMPPMV